MGTKAHEKVREYMKPDVVSSGAKEKTARYLGAWPQDNNKLNTEIQKRCAAMLTGYYAFFGVWGSTKVPFVLQKLFFTAIVTSAGLAGLEPFAIPEALIIKLESVRTNLIRRMFGKSGWGKVKGDSTHRAVTHVSIRKRAKIFSVDSTLRQRRLMWMRQIMFDPDYHKQYLAASFGKFDWEETKKSLLMAYPILLLSTL